ncbi:hypothetical protein PLICRDRAFT_169713 [Plicaturopsis crispa FD-325 SS-3]|nr:hypothetical protein PLICRDRAFT_169713 [Plicaturopsis crispa FD-325 SS-3]
MVFAAPIFLLLLALLSPAFASLSTPHRRSHRLVRADVASEYLTAHNNIRAEFGANALTWSDDLANKAQTWANECQFRHSDGMLQSESYGENLAAGAGWFSPAAAVQVFTQDFSEYSPENPTYNHFTQVVWKATTQLGCASAKCDGIFAAEWGKATYHVCLYDPAGNVVGNATANVQV